MNILYYSPSNCIGGAELSLLEIIKSASNARQKVFIALPPPKNGDFTYMNMLRKYCHGIFIVRPMKWHLTKQNSIINRVVSYIYSIILSGWYIFPTLLLIRIIKLRKIDIVHTNTMMAIEGALASKILSIKHIWHIREGIGYHDESIVQFPFQRFPKLFRYLTKNITDVAIVNSFHTKELAKPYFPKRKIKIIYNALHDNWFVKRKHRSKKNKIVIGVVANVTSKVKNHKLVISLANHLFNICTENIIFNIYGSIPKNDIYFHDLKKHIKDYKLEDVVLFKGVENPDKIYDTIDILFHPFSKESFGRIYIEAMGKGIPVVALDGGGAKELIKENITGFKVDNDIIKISEKILLLIEKPKIYDKISSNGFEFSVNNFKSSLIWKKLIRVYVKVLKS